MEAPNRIRELRLDADLSQQALADAVGVSKVTISDLERGKMQLTVDYMRRISRALNVASADLLARDDNPYSLTDQERELIDRLREADPDQRDQLAKIADVMIPWKGADRSAA